MLTTALALRHSPTLREELLAAQAEVLQKPSVMREVLGRVGAVSAQGPEASCGASSSLG